MKYVMKDNYGFIPYEIRHDSIDTTIQYNKRKIMKLFMRFLKEKGIYKTFVNNFHNEEIGESYRKFLVTIGVMKQNVDELIDFFNAFNWNLYFLNSFLWVDKDFWSDAHCEWLNYVANKKNSGLL